MNNRFQRQTRRHHDFAGRAAENSLFSNTAGGNRALISNTTGFINTAVDADALFVNTTGNGNTAIGANGGAGIMTASNVICIGSGRMDVSNTTWIGNVYGTTTVSGTTRPVIVSDGG